MVESCRSIFSIPKSTTSSYSSLSKPASDRHRQMEVVHFNSLCKHARIVWRNARLAEIERRVKEQPIRTKRTAHECKQITITSSGHVVFALIYSIQIHIPRNSDASLLLLSSQLSPQKSRQYASKTYTTHFARFRFHSLKFELFSIYKGIYLIKTWYKMYIVCRCSIYVKL